MSVTHVTHHIQSEYQPTVWARLLHQVPHVNITFHRLQDERFRPDSELYLESLGIIGSVPAAWLILTLIILLIYLLTRCCDTKNNKVIFNRGFISIQTGPLNLRELITSKVGVSCTLPCSISVTVMTLSTFKPSPRLSICS